MKAFVKLAILGLILTTSAIKVNAPGSERLPGQTGNEKAHDEQDKNEEREERYKRLEL